MKRLWLFVLLGTVGMLRASAAHAGPVWSLDWQFGSNAVISNTGRSAIAFLQEFLPRLGEFSAMGRTMALNFLRLAQKSNICAEEAAVLAAQWAPSASLPS